MQTRKTLEAYLGKIRLFKNSLRGVDIWQIEGGAGMTRVEDGGHATTWW